MLQVLQWTDSPIGGVFEIGLGFASTVEEGRAETYSRRTCRERLVDQPSLVHSQKGTAFNGKSSLAAWLDMV